MAVEATLCPQCGAAIRLAAGQTEGVCAHCGTPVVRPTALSSIEKEQAAEQLVQATITQEKQLFAHGRSALGEIVTAQATDIFRQTVKGRAVLMAFGLKVQPDGADPFTAACKALITLAAVDKYQAGTLLDVRYDPQDHARVAILGRHGATNSSPPGGDAWKEGIVNWAADEFRKAQGIDLRQDPQAVQRLRQAAENARIELTSELETDLNLPFIAVDAGGPKHLNLRLSRAKFEQLTAGRLDS